MSNDKKDSKTTSISRAYSIISWVVAIIFILIGLILITSSWFVGLLAVITGVIYIPSVSSKIPGHIKGLGIIKGLMIAVILISLIAISPETNTNQTEVQDEQSTEHDVSPSEDGNTTDDQMENTEVISDNNTEVAPVQDREDENENTDTNDTEADPVPVQDETLSQKNSVRQAKDYLEYTAFSYQGLISQLEYEGYSNADATYGADNSGADWFEQAAKKAEDYMSYSAFSRSGLISQLEYEGFTRSQAEHGADAVGF